MAQITGIAAEMERLHKAVAQLEAEGVAETKAAARLVMSNLLLNTPVWKGETVRNYKWSLKPGGGSHSPATGSGEPGATNSMIMGSEPRRPANEAAALAEMDGVMSFNKLSDLFVTNTIDAAKWDLIDNGSAPSPGKARNPGGVSILAEQSARNALKNWK
jgi:hypothetical protein